MEVETLEDWRSLDKYERRRRIIKMRKDGRSTDEIAQMCFTSRGAIGKVLRKYAPEMIGDFTKRQWMERMDETIEETSALRADNERLRNECETFYNLLLDVWQYTPHNDGALQRRMIDALGEKP